VAPVAEPLAELAEQDHGQEDQTDDEHRLDYFLAFLRSGLRGERQHGAILLHPQPVLRDGLLGRRRRLPLESRGLALPEGRRCRRPRHAVARKPVGAELGAARDQLRQVADSLDRPCLRDADEPVRVEVVAEQQCRVVVARREEPRAPVMEQVALVDRLEPERVALLAQRREDRLSLRLVGQRLVPEPTLARGLLDDRVPDGDRYSQPASSFVQ